MSDQIDTALTAEWEQEIREWVAPHPDAHMGILKVTESRNTTKDIRALLAEIDRLRSDTADHQRQVQVESAKAEEAVNEGVRKALKYVIRRCHQNSFTGPAVEFETLPEKGLPRGPEETEMSDEAVIYDDGNRIVRRAAEKAPTKGGAHAFYQIVPNGGGEPINIDFQHDTILDVGVVGGTNECYLAIVKDRLEGFQSGDFPCEENAEALAHVEAALALLEWRTYGRKARGVEGKHEA